MNDPLEVKIEPVDVNDAPLEVEIIEDSSHIVEVLQGNLKFLLLKNRGV